MMRHFLICGLLIAALNVQAFGEDKHNHLPAAPTNAGLEKMKEARRDLGGCRQGRQADR